MNRMKPGIDYTISVQVWVVTLIYFEENRFVKCSFVQRHLLFVLESCRVKLVL